MGLFDKFKKDKKDTVHFHDIDSMEKAIQLAQQGVLEPLYLMPLRFQGEEVAHNRVFVPPFVVELKERYDDMVEQLLVEGKVNGYSCSPQYIGQSFVPSQIQIIAKLDGTPIFTETISIW